MGENNFSNSGEYNKEEGQNIREDFSFEDIKEIINTKKERENILKTSFENIDTEDRQKLINSLAASMPNKFDKNNKTQVYTIQLICKLSGNDNISLDGIWGPQTQKMFSELIKRKNEELISNNECKNGDELSYLLGNINKLNFIKDTGVGQIIINNKKFFYFEEEYQNDIGEKTKRDNGMRNIVSAISKKSGDTEVKISGLKSVYNNSNGNKFITVATIN